MKRYITLILLICLISFTLSADIEDFRGLWVSTVFDTGGMPFITNIHIFDIPGGYSSEVYFTHFITKDGSMFQSTLKKEGQVYPLSYDTETGAYDQVLIVIPAVHIPDQSGSGIKDDYTYILYLKREGELLNVRYYNIMAGKEPIELSIMQFKFQGYSSW